MAFQIALALSQTPSTCEFAKGLQLLTSILKTLQRCSQSPFKVVRQGGSHFCSAAFASSSCMAARASASVACLVSNSAQSLQCEAP